MRKKNIFLISAGLFLVLILSVSLISAGGGDYSSIFQGPQQSKSVSCDNSVCEHVDVELAVGEEKTVQVGEKSYRFKVVNIEKESQTGQVTREDGSVKEETWYNYKTLLSVDGSQPMDEQGIREKLGFNIGISYLEPSPKSTGPEKVILFFNENDICGVPDCAFRAELTLSQKWNLVPLYMLMGGVDGGGDLERTLKKGTCKQESFRAVYMYNPLKKTYVKLLSYGMPTQDLGHIAESFEEQGIIAATPFNSVLLYSTAECKLVADLPKSLEKFLLVLSVLSEQAEQEVGEVSKPLQPPPIEVPVEEASKAAVSGQFLGNFDISRTGKPGFAPGWNFFSGSKDMEGKNFEEIRGNCVIEKAYGFDAKNQQWARLTTAPGPESGFIFKVKDKCLLGYPEVAPPEVPAGKLIARK